MASAGSHPFDFCLAFILYNLENRAMIEFENLQALWLLGFLPLFWLWEWLKTRRQKQKMSAAIHSKTLPRIQNDFGKSLQGWKSFLELTTLFLMIIAFSGPKIGAELREIQREGVDILIALDLSRSMTVEDISPSRIDRAKFEIQKMIHNLGGDRIGLIAFAGVAHLHCPLTLDHSAALMLLDVMDQSLLPVQGTALGDAVNIARKSFTTSEKKHKALIIISDGEDHEKAVEEAAMAAAAEGIVIFTLGVGTLAGGPIPIKKGEKIQDYKRDGNGQIIISRLEEKNLQAIAEKSGGRYLRLTDMKEPLDKIYQDIGNLEQKQYQTHQFSQYETIYYIPLILAILFFFTALSLPHTWRKKGESAQ
jgi:Ca-activated chloride channel homolog